MKYIIIHSSVNTLFKKDKWHYLIRKNGEIEALMSENKNARHCICKNKNSIAVCFEGLFNEKETYSKEQIYSGKKLIKELKNKYPNAAVLPHKAFLPVNCPGEFFPINELVN